MRRIIAAIGQLASFGQLIGFGSISVGKADSVKRENGIFLMNIHNECHSFGTLRSLR